LTVGHPNTLANGGPGRALIVLPQAWFYEDQYLALRDALGKRGIDIQTCSSQSDVAYPKHKEIKPVKLSTTLDTFDVNDFGTVIFIGGNVREFMHKGPAFKQT